MTRFDRHDDRSSDRSTADEFAADLDALCARALDDGVDLAGAYDVRSPRRDRPDFTVEISEITKPLHTGRRHADPVE